MTSRLPHLLEPYLSLPSSSSLVVLTSVLGASTNWLLCRHLYALLKPSHPHSSSSHNTNRPQTTRAALPPTNEDDGDVSVLLVSFLRDLTFWKENLSRLGLDLEAAARKGRFGERKVVLVIDGLDFVLAASSPSLGPGDTAGTAMALMEMVMDLREKTHAAIITLAADDPLIKEQETALEKQHAWFALSMVHQADTLLNLRLLDTGAAKDVSGVIRITHGGEKSRTRDHEYLYHVGGDGGVRVFERGQ
ncbi:hypothetical protein N0V88_003497 [Collariella sp. IMI 366227]|nr:hypothetical protein N0V88_003497 [Collariella sp. IMI 366227]